MSTYKFLISKNNIARDSDENITFDDPNGGEDISVTLFVDGTEIHAATLVDAGCVLEYTGTLAEGYHTVKIVPEAGKPTDIRIDHVLIDDSRIVGSQYLLDTRIFGKAFDFFRFKSCVPFKSPKLTDHVWWGDVYNADYTIKSHTTYYRPHVVTDLGEWWEWSFSVTSNGHIHWECCDSDSILYDSTENHSYYAAKSILYNDSATYPQVDVTQLPFGGDSSGGDSSIGAWVGYGSYNSTLNLESLSGFEDSDNMVINSYTEWQTVAWYYLVYWPAHNIEPIIVS